MQQAALEALALREAEASCNSYLLLLRRLLLPARVGGHAAAQRGRGVHCGAVGCGTLRPGVATLELA